MPDGSVSELSDPRYFLPGERALLEVEILDHAHGDLTNVRVEMKGFRQSFWVPTALLRRPVKPSLTAAR